MFEDRLKRARQEVGEDANTLREIDVMFAAEHAHFFLVANQGKAPDSDADSEAKQAAALMKKYLRTAQSLKHERKKEQVNASYADSGFSFGIPKAGWWGFCALGAGGELEHGGKELSLDAVIWIQAVDME